MRNKRSKRFVLAPFSIPSVLREVWCWEYDDVSHAGILACLGADAGGEQRRDVVQVRCDSCPISVSSYGAHSSQVLCLQVNSKKKLLLASPWTRLASVPSGPSQNLPQAHLTLGHEDIGVARCRELQEQLQNKHILTSSKSVTSDPKSCEINPKSRVKGTCPVLLEHFTLPQPDMTSCEAVSCTHIVNQWLEGWAQSWAWSWLTLSLLGDRVPRHCLMPWQAMTKKLSKNAKFTVLKTFVECFGMLYITWSGSKCGNSWCKKVLLQDKDGMALVIRVFCRLRDHRR